MGFGIKLPNIPNPGTHGELVHQLSHPISNTYSSMTGDKNSKFAQTLDKRDSMLHPFGTLEDRLLNSKGPEAPAENSNLTKTLAAQQANANSFRAGIPQMEQSLQNEVSKQGAAQLGQNLRATRESNSSRGLLFGGINQGQEQGDRANMAAGLARSRANINANVQNSADTLDAQAVNTAMGVQKNRQQIQDSIYQQAMGDLNAQGSAFKGGMNFVGSVAGGMMGGK